MSDTVKIIVDGAEHVVPAGELLIKAAQDEGTYIPRFCWHERMNPVGMCRMCLVEVETPRGPMLITACTNPVSDGMVIDTKGESVKKAQESVLEFLLANHPLDCPVCDKGGECPLQDQAMSHGPGESRFVEIKRHYEKPIPISDLVLLDRERCILCARCTRFSDEISGDPLIEFQDRGNTTQVNTFPDLPFSSYFSGNTVQICPVGALTAKPYRFRARPWDLQMIESSSMFDTAHPRISVQASQNEILRILGVDIEATNHGWLADKDRFGFEHLRSSERLTSPLVRRDGDLVEISWAEALDIVANRVDLIRSEDGGGGFGVIGGAHGTNEDAYALSKFARVVLETNNVDARVDNALGSHFLAATIDRALISDVDDADVILVWGPDLKEEHPTLYLRVRRAAQELGVPLVVVHPRSNGLDDRADHQLRYRPGGGFELLDDLEAGEHPEISALLAKGKTVVIVGQASLADDPLLAESVAAYARSRADHAAVLPLARRANTYGALDMGLAPDLLPGRLNLDEGGRGILEEHWGPVPEVVGKDTEGILEAAESGEIRMLMLVGADPVGDLPRPDQAKEALESAEYVVSLDTFIHDSNRQADLILPVAGFSEKEGTATNLEGRVQKLNLLIPGPGQTRSEWSVLEDIAHRTGRSLGFGSVDTVAKELATVVSGYQDVTWEALEWEHRDGIIAFESGQPITHIPVAIKGERAPRAELTLHSARTMYDDGVRLRHSPSLYPLAPGPRAYLNPEDATRLGARDGVGLTVVTKHGEGEFEAVVDSGTPAGVVYVPANQPGAASLGTDPVVRVKTS